MRINKIFRRLLTFLKEVKREIKKINWPTKQETIRYTVIVIGISIGVAIYLGGFDFIFNFSITKFIFK